MKELLPGTEWRGGDLACWGGGAWASASVGWSLSRLWVDSWSSREQLRERGVREVSWSPGLLELGPP